MNNQMTALDAPEDSGSGSFIAYIPRIILERKWLLIVPAAIGLLGGIATAFILPVTYQSKAVLLVEAPQLPEGVTLETGGLEVVDQRMARMRQQVLSRPALIEIIRRNGLYQTEQTTSTLSDVIEDMRNAIAISPVTADIQAANSGKKSTIAFSLAYNYSDPVKAQIVTQALTQQVLQLDATTTSAQAANTVEFLTDQANGVMAQITDLEKTISSIKAENGVVLSGSAASVGGSAVAYDTQISILEQANAQLRTQRTMNSTAADRDPGVQQAETALATARATYTETHPDVILAKQRLAEAKSLAKTRQDALPSNGVDSQIASNNQQIAALRSARGQAQGMMAAGNRAPVIMEQVSQLQQKLDGLNTQYDKIAQQLFAARAGKKADDQQQGERLSVIDPPVTPDKPISPNRPILIAAGLVGGVGLGLFLILAIELVLRPIRGTAAVTQLIGEPPLVVIPTITSTAPRKGGFLSKLWPFGKKSANA